MKFIHMDDLDIIGIYEIAELAGVNPSAVVNWRTRDLDFPQPVVELKSGPVFFRRNIRKWLERRKGTNQEMGSDAVRIGLRLLEFECGVTANIDDTNSAELVDYELSRAAGQAARLAMLIRGQDVIDDEQRLKKIAAMELSIHPAEYNVAKRLLMEADLIEERTTRLGKVVLNEKVSRLNHADNYRRVGEIWLAGRDRSRKEEALVHTLDEVIQAPTAVESIGMLRELDAPDRAAVLELASNAGVIDSVDESKRIYYSPLLWDVNRVKLAAYMKIAGSAFADVLKKVRKPGTDLTKTRDPMMMQAISGGILPSYRVNSTGGERLYSFTPYTGSLLRSDEEKVVLEKARALIACLRYGSEAATITRIRDPLLILRALTDPTRNHRLRPHSELKLQYGMLVAKQIGRVIRTDNGRYIFGLIPTEDNLRACAIARELLSTGELMGEKDPDASAALHLVNGTIQQPLREVRIARKKRPARADELAALVEQLRSV